MTTINRKEEIRTAAAKLFGEKGFTASSVRDIASAVGLGAASLYNHMESKDELLTSICFRCAESFSKGMEEVLQSPNDPLRKIEMLIRLHVEIALYDRSSITVFNDEWRHMQQPYLASFLQMRRAYESAYLAIIKSGIEEELISEKNPYLIYQYILSSLRWLHQPGVRKMKMEESELTEQIISLLIKSIAP